MDESNNDRASMEEEPKSFIELVAKRKNKTNEMKLQIALLSQSIIEDPEGKVLHIYMKIILDSSRRDNAF